MKVVPEPEAQGFVSISINIPSIYENMCGMVYGSMSFSISYTC